MKTYMKSAFVRSKFPVISTKQSSNWCKSCNAYLSSYLWKICSECSSILWVEAVQSFFCCRQIKKSSCHRLAAKKNCVISNSTAQQFTKFQPQAYSSLFRGRTFGKNTCSREPQFARFHFKPSLTIRVWTEKWTWSTRCSRPTRKQKFCSSSVNGRSETCGIENTTSTFSNPVSLFSAAETDVSWRRQSLAW